MGKGIIKVISCLSVMLIAVVGLHSEAQDDSSLESDEGLDLLYMIPVMIATQSSQAPSPQGNSNSPPADRPGPDNTGPSGPLSPVVGGFTVRDDGAIIENIDLDGCISIRANNVTVRNSRIDCDSFYAIRINSGFTGTLIEDVEMIGTLSSAVLGSDFTIRRSNIHDMGADAFKPGSNVLIESSWMHRLGTIDGSHSDGMQMVAGGNVVFRGNFVDMPDVDGFTNSQCIILQTNNGPIDNVLIEDNWLNGGGYCVQVNPRNGNGPPTNIVIRNNQFGPDCQFGTILVRGDDSDTTLDNNIFTLTGNEIGVDEPIDSCGNDFE